MAAVFNPEELSPPLAPEREAARQVLNDEEREILEAMERDLGRPLTRKKNIWLWSLAHSSSSHAGQGRERCALQRRPHWRHGPRRGPHLCRVPTDLCRVATAAGDQSRDEQARALFTEIETLRARIEGLEEKH